MITRILNQECSSYQLWKIDSRLIKCLLWWILPFSIGNDFLLTICMTLVFFMLFYRSMNKKDRKGSIQATPSQKHV